MFGTVVSDGLVHAPRQGHGAVRFLALQIVRSWESWTCQKPMNKRGNTAPAVVHACRFMAFRSGCGLDCGCDYAQYQVIYPIRHDDESEIQNPFADVYMDVLLPPCQSIHSHASRLSLKPPELVSRQRCRNNDYLSLPPT
jgi:hypothetical protein